MSSQQIRKHLDGILNFLQPHWNFVNCHMVNYLTDSYWQTFIPPAIQNSITSNDDIDAIITDTIWQPNINNNFNQLTEFLHTFHKFQLENLTDIIKSKDDVYQILNIIPKHESLTIKEFMTDKKRHEVEITAELIADLVKFNTNNSEDIYIVDAGDGKGYLSSRLALQYNMKVLGIDSNEMNTESAQERNRKLQRVWNGLAERAELISQGKKPQRRGKKRLNLIDEKTSTTKQFNKYKTINKFINSNLDIQSILKDEFQPSHLSDDSINMNICLTGLHTCGNLASTCLKVFCEQKSIQMICNIGCCYHLINEEFSNDEFFANQKITSKNLEFGFPMSDYLRNQNVRMGRNARMLAAQSLHRSIANQEISSKSLFYRALLEILFKEKFPHLRNCVQVGKIQKYNNFPEYLMKCDSKLKLGINHLHFLDYEKMYAKEEQLLKLFYLIRMHFAPVLETLILLDRLLYLKENGFENSFLIALFDPVISPRCYAIISMRDA